MPEKVVKEPSKINMDGKRRFRVVVPKRGAVDRLGIRKDHPVRVLIDEERRRIIYELLD